MTPGLLVGGRSGQGRLPGGWAFLLLITSCRPLRVRSRLNRNQETGEKMEY